MENDKNDIKTIDKPWLFKKGNPGGPGRTVGLRDFNTDFDEAVEELAKEQGITISEARKNLLKVAYIKAKEGNYNFYKDTIDRNYGTTTQKTDLTSGGKSLDLISLLKQAKND